MIFLTVGTQLPFDRLVKSVDRWAGEHQGVNVFGQIGRTTYVPKHFAHRKTLTPEEFEEKCSESRVIIGHVGMGTIITGMSINVPMILMPRLCKLGEHRNDHQLATAKRFEKFDSVTIISDYNDLDSALTMRLGRSGGESFGMSPQVSASLIKTIHEFIHTKN